MIRLTIKPLMILALSCAFSSVHAERIAPRNLQQEQQNLRLVENFYNQFFNQHDLNAAQVIAPDYKQHNPYVADGKQPFVDYFKEEFQKHPESKAKIVRHATQGDLVYLLCIRQKTFKIVDKQSWIFSVLNMEKSLSIGMWCKMYLKTLPIKIRCFN